MNIVEMFENTVSKYPERQALVDMAGTRPITYAELDTLSGRVAGKLRASGYKKGSFVIILTDRRYEYFAAYLGILKAGMAVVPLVPDYPEERISYIKSNSEAVTVITESFFDDIDTYPVLTDSADDDAPAMLIYTSGSTGTPKGILYSVYGLSNSVSNHKTLYDGVSDIRHAATGLLSFCIHVAEYLTPLTMGGTVYIVPDGTRRSVHQLEDFILNNNITTAFIPPQLLRLYNNKAPSLRMVYAAGERVSNVYSPDFLIRNAYGMSEVGIISTFDIDKKYESTPIGKAVNGTTFLILDEHGQPVPDGAEGEICFLGNYGTCYFKDEQRTREYMPKQNDGRTLLHSGDVGYFDENKNMVYVNRRDWMVKINGQRVETLEIESLLFDMDEVSGGAVKAFEDADSQTYLVAYYSLDKDVTESEIRRRLLCKLPEYMMPRYFVKMDEMPKNVNGKLDRKSLLPPTFERYKAAYAAPETKTEEAICEAMERVLRCGKVGICDDFFALGGDSIKVLRLIDEAHVDGLGTDIVFEGKTPRDMAKLCTEKTEKIAHSEEIPASAPLSESQLGVYLECVASPNSLRYNIPVLCRLPRDTDARKFICAVKKVAESHPAMKVTVTDSYGTPKMIYHDGEISVSEK
ncbi:MAG: AMP-binding protein, partial [Clostridiales bacterium]|nr:AMP-binding protein [Clostridiales bacterium]